ncbi:MAG: hypothetical protein H7A22_15620 [Spirochaetales bacterium]|nr:hypothetical protein [Spirochaetales bacterium]
MKTETDIEPQAVLDVREWRAQVAAQYAAPKDLSPEEQARRINEHGDALLKKHRLDLPVLGPS